MTPGAGASVPMRYDHREDASGIPAALRDAGLQMLPADLPVGDYVISDQLCVERKAAGDLSSSIRDGRLFDQAERLLEAYPVAVLLIERRPDGVFAEQWRGAVCKLLESGITVLQSTGVDDSARWIARLAKRARRDPAVIGALPAGRRRSPTTPAAQAEQMLSAVPGISHVAARRILRHFGSVAHVSAATERELRAVPGIGPRRASQLRSALHGTHET
ncbi:MAG: helicase-associated endonuclease for fork-structured [Solirubrobacterales bacterium]|nr:helicase-associated endonuclease for fork-structured [Solirubrobacterales bacterium]